MSDKYPDKSLSYDHDFESVVRTPLYFGSDSKQLLGWLHKTDSPHQSNTGVVICPPLAVEYMSTYRSMRYVADYFALAGIPSFRFDYHGVGDSSGSNDEGNRLDEWLWSIEQANSKVKQLTGCEKVGLFGLRMGATLAALVSEKIEIDFLVLWAALDSGRKYIREMRAIQLTGISQSGAAAPAFIEAGGLVYWQQTADAISKIDLLNITPQASRVLIIPRDDLQVNTKLQKAWEALGVNIEQVEHPGSSDMCLVALKSVVPHESIGKIVDWVRAGVSDQSTTCHDLVKQNVTTSALIAFNSESNKEVSSHELKLKESFVSFGSDKKNFAILTEPVSLKAPELPIIVFVNSGATHRVGPSRLYVLLARELACLGFRCLRIDIPGLGDSIIDNNREENREYIEQSSVVLQKALESFGPEYKKNRYIITGLCSGAYFSFHAALDLDDVNIVESILINPLTFYWHEGMEFDASASPTKNFGSWNWYKQAIKDPKSWLKLVRGGADYTVLYDTIKNRIKIVFTAKINSLKSHSSNPASNNTLNDLNIDLMKISNSTYLSFVLARSDPGYDILMTSAGKTAKKLIKAGKIDVYLIDDADHTFSKYQPRGDVINTMVKHIVYRYC